MEINDGNIKKIKNKVINKEQEYDSYPGISNTASANECTGMMYYPPQNEEELESYQELFNMQIPKKQEDDVE